MSATVIEIAAHGVERARKLYVEFQSALLGGASEAEIVRRVVRWHKAACPESLLAVNTIGLRHRLHDARTRAANARVDKDFERTRPDFDLDRYEIAFAEFVLAEHELFEVKAALAAAGEETP